MEKKIYAVKYENKSKICYSWLEVYKIIEKHKGAKWKSFVYQDDLIDASENTEGSLKWAIVYAEDYIVFDDELEDDELEEDDMGWDEFDFFAEDEELPLEWDDVTDENVENDDSEEGGETNEDE